MRVLAVMREQPYPLDNGVKLRAFHFLREMGGRYEVFLVHFGRPDVEAREVEQYTSKRVEVTGIDIRAGSPRGICRVLTAMRLGLVWPDDYAMSVVLRDAI